MGRLVDDFPINFVDPWGLVGKASGFGLGDAALIGGGFVPVVGELIDFGVMLAPSSSLSDRIFSGLSLGANALTAGLLPNFGGFARSASDFIVSPGGTAFPVPRGATGPVPVVNKAGNQTGTAFTGGKGGANQHVDSIRIMDPTAPHGRSLGYPDGYIKYENSAGQGVNPYTGRTGSRADTHFPLD